MDAPAWRSLWSFRGPEARMITTAVVEIASYSVLAFATALFVLQAVARDIGYWFGHREARRGGTPPEGVGVVVGGMLGLLAFVLALTLSFATTRFQERRDGTLVEANAIGTAWLRAQAIGHPRGSEIAHLLEDYIQVRRDFVTANALSTEIGGLNTRSDALQSEIWGHVTTIVRERPDPVATSLMAALNETFDRATAERFALSMPFPVQLFWLLIGMSTVTMAALGYQLGLRQRPLRVLSWVLMAMWTATMTIILDFGAARVGDIRTGTQA